MSLRDLIKYTQDYFTNTNDMHDDIRAQIVEQLERATMGDKEAKEFLAGQLRAKLTHDRITARSVYPNVTPEMSLIFRSFGQMELDAVLAQSPMIENIWITEDKPIYYTERGKIKMYDYTPSKSDLETLQNKISHIIGGSLHSKRSALSGTIPGSNLRIQMYCPPRSVRRRIIVRNPDSGHLNLRTMEMDENIRTLLRNIAKSNGSVIIAGAMDAGKTTMLRSIILEKNPDTNLLTIIEKDRELAIEDYWGNVVVELLYVEDEEFEVSFGHLFRNSTSSIALGEARYPFEAHYVLESAGRSTGFTFTTLHLKVVSPENALRTFEELVYRYRRDARDGIRKDIAENIDFFVMMTRDYETGRRYPSSIFCPTYNSATGELKANHLVYYDSNLDGGKYVWTGQKIPEEKRYLFFSQGEANIEELIQLGVW